MAALTLANMLARVKRYVPTTTMDTELQDALLERMNALVSADVFPFQEKYQDTTLADGDYTISTPSNFANIKSIVIWEGDNKERELIVLSATEFSQLFPKPDEQTEGTPTYCCIRVAESEVWFDCPADGDLTVRLEFLQIPDDATDTTVSQLTELAKMVVINWGIADGFNMNSEHDRANVFENKGGIILPDGRMTGFLGVMQRRYQLALEKDARIISPQLRHALRSR